MTKALLMTAAIAIVGYGGWRMTRGPAPEPTDGARLALDRVWIDHIPRGERDTIQVFAVSTAESVGVFQHTSVWKGGFELFRHQVQGETIRAVFPQDGSREQLRVKARACDVNGMDYCLELAGASRGVKTYYSRKGWELDGVRSPHQLETAAQAIVDRLATAPDLPAE